MAPPPPPPHSACRRIEGSWTLSTLVASYLDLALAYLFLCASSLAYFAAVFLSLFGLSLPCSCSWSAGAFFRRPNLPPPAPFPPDRRRGPGCLQGFLVDYPLAKVAGVHSSVHRRFPFGADFSDDGGCCFCGFSAWDDVKLVKDRTDGDEVDDDGGGGRGVARRALLDMGEGTESSCCSVSKPGVSESLSPVLAGDLGEERKGESYGPIRAGVEFKGKGVPFILRESPPKLTRSSRPRRSISMGVEKSPLGSPSTPLQVNWKGEAVGINPFAGIRLQSGVEDNSSTTLFSQNIPGGGATLCSGSMLVDKGLSDSAKLVFGSGISEVSVIEDLKQALEEEKRALAALSMELEKERSSAATAANETMAMILRLQEEKAAIEMEARQYKRMVEEKSAYDEEEMEILKEIIIRREREKHMLEKEVEAYHQMMLGDTDVEQPLVDGICDGLQLVGEKDGSLHSSDSELMLNEVYKSVNHMGNTKDDLCHCDDCGPSSAKDQMYATNSVEGSYETEDVCFPNLDDVKQSHTFERQSGVELDCGVYCNVQEKGTVNMEVFPSAMQTKRLIIESSIHQMTELQGKGLHESTSSFSCKGKNVQVNSDNLNSSYDVAGNKSTLTLSPLENDSILDVHVIDDKPHLGGVSNAIGPTPIQCASKISLSSGSRNEASVAELVDYTKKESDTLCKRESPSIHKSCSDMVMMQSPSSSSQRASWLNLRRTSMPYIDSERFKLENEVDLLRKRLKLIEEGRERIAFSEEQREKEVHHLQLLEEISCQLQEIRKATEPGKSTHHIPLPSSSQGNLKKRRCHSVSVELNENN